MRVSEGDGWRLQLDPGRRPFIALIGGQDWAIELDHGELSCLRRGVRTLLGQHLELRDLLMPEEDLALEFDLCLPARAKNGAPGSLFVALSGTAERWSLRFVLTPADGSRAAEGGWTPAASAALAAALEGLADDAGSAESELEPGS